MYLVFFFFFSGNCLFHSVEQPGRNRSGLFSIGNVLEYYLLSSHFPFLFSRFLLFLASHNLPCLPTVMVSVRASFIKFCFMN